MSKMVISLLYILDELNFLGEYFCYCPIIAYIFGWYHDDIGAKKLKVLSEGQSCPLPVAMLNKVKRKH